MHSWRNWTLRWKKEANEDLDIDRFSLECPSEKEVLELTPLPCWATLTAKERSRLVAQLVAQIDATAPNPSTQDPRHITQQHPHGAPLTTKHSPRPKVHASTKRRWIEAVQRYRDFLSDFRRASCEWLSGAFNVEFPLHSFRPPPWFAVARIV
jgi:hypothetical protein